VNSRSLRVLAICLLGSSCVNLSYNSYSVQQPIPDDAFAQLLPGKSEFGDCLRILGGPLRVQEYQIHGIAAAWGWSDADSFGFFLSYNFARFAPAASFRWDAAGTDIPGAVLFFDESLILERVRRGYLSTILPVKPPVATVEQVES